MTDGLTETTIKTVKATIPALKEHGGDIILNFYDILFTRYPAVRSYFNMDRQKKGVSKEGGLPTQVHALASAVLAYAENIDNLEPILPVVERICHKHVSRGVVAPQYDAVGECLLAAIKEVLKEAATDNIMNAWTEAYTFLAKIFIDIETKLKKELSEKAGYEGMTEMRVASITKTEEYKYIGLIPTSKGIKVPPFENGQYVTIEIVLDDAEHTMTSKRLIPKQDDLLTVEIPLASKEKATITLCNSKVDDVLKISMPCGKSLSN